jgi:pimeloyl-ACP methyl ester carboxylesterase
MKMNPTTKMVTSTVIFLIIAYVAICLLLFLFQRFLIYFPDKNIVFTPAQIGLTYEDVTLTTSDHEKIHAWWIAADTSAPVLLFCHGNAGNISHRLESIQIFHALGLNVVIFDYRGFGRSSGTPDEEGTYRDAESVWNYLIAEKNFHPEQIVIFGRSLGSGIASWLARQHQPGALILESSYTSLPDLGARIYPYFPVRLLARYHYPTVNNLRHINSPVLFIHSRDDEIIHFVLGEENFRQANEPKQFLEIQGSHNDGFLVSGQIYREQIGAFLAAHLDTGDGP